MLPPLVFVLGPTASGKTALAAGLAERFGPAVLVSLDSRQVYRGMDVATGKEGEPGELELPALGRVPAWYLPNRVAQVGVDLVEPGERWTAAKHAAWCRRAIRGACEGGLLPILVGGTGLYAEALLRGYAFGDGARPPRPESTLVLEPRVSREDLRRRIFDRVDAWLDSGRLQEEVAHLRKRVPAGSEAWTGIGYRELGAWLDGALTLDDVTRRVKKHTWDYARRQRTYLRNRLPEARPVDRDAALAAVERFLKLR